MNWLPADAITFSTELLSDGTMKAYTLEGEMYSLPVKEFLITLSQMWKDGFQVEFLPQNDVMILRARYIKLF